MERFRKWRKSNLLPFWYDTYYVPSRLKNSRVVKTNFNKTNQLFLEIDMDDPNMMSEMMAGMMMKDTSTLQGLLGANFDTTNKIFKSKSGFGLEMMNRAKPILLMSLVYPALLGCQPESWEKVFQNMAAEKQMKLFGLEKLADQMSVFDSIPNKLQADMFYKMMMNLDSAKISFNAMMETYKKKDVNAMVTMMTKDEDFGDYEALITYKQK